MSFELTLEHAIRLLHSSLTLLTSLVGFIAIVAFATQRSPEISSAPLFTPTKSAAGNRKRRWMYDSVNLLQEGYKMFQGKPFQIWTTEGAQVVIPPDFVDELKMLPDHTFPSALRHFFLHKYLWPIDQHKLDYGHVVIKNDLNKSMSRVFPELCDEVDAVFPLEFPEFKGWTPIQVYPKMLRLVSRINGKIFVGPSLYDNEEWITISCNYTKNLFLSSAKLRFFHPWLRPMAQFFIPELRAVWKCNERAQALLTPVLHQRQAQEASASKGGGGEYKKPNDSIEWLRDLVPGPDKNDPLFHAISQLGIGAVSVNTTCQLLTNSLFNLAAYPEYLPMLREEIESVWAANNQHWTLASMGQLKRLDSFIKETLRFNGHLTATFQRVALRPITLSDGTTIPPGTYTFAPTNAVNFDSEVYPDPEAFDGLRFYKLRQASSANESKYQLTSITKTELQFGSGRHACPGRWFASHEIKLVLAAVIRRFDLRLKGEERPKGMLFQTNQLPDVKAEILFKERRM
ncbi:cytochrome P450 [Aspergillus clavatus NRRL 1]|uniref:Cytochrome P450 n=1 Tax=Aspergillus clavatus (strain ATCC 1007 / CBS 513.65 / DSM 816 / NCTC 3887 / NRRL 1 / QM 1276 / 107) TaxID=344612 RepID=A1C9K6_ASPCL|nr:cytochrome P450 [Aspergillus clavatus NRRL 1]EAW13530.1 cytochrome P450 [Aspergillus clavatus NRRL 1]